MYMKAKSALITGATGFIGSHLAKRLSELEWETHIVIRKFSNTTLIDPFLEKLNVHILEENYSNLNSIVSNIKPDCSFHIASLFLSSHKWNDIPRLIDSNILFGSLLLESLVNNECLNLVNTSTSWEHYKQNEYNPVNLYAATKKAFIDIAKYYVEANNLNLITLKLFDTYGPNDPRKKLIKLLINAAFSGEVLDLSPGEQKINLVHVKDIVEAYVLVANYIMDTKYLNKEFFIKSNKEYNLQEIVSFIEAVVGEKVNINWGGRPYRNREVMVPPRNNKILPGWQPQISLKQGLKELCDNIAP